MFFYNCYPKSMYDTAAACTRTLNYEYIVYGLILIIIACAAAIGVILVMQYRNHRRSSEIFIAEEFLPAGLYDGGPGELHHGHGEILQVDDRADMRNL